MNSNHRGHLMASMLAAVMAVGVGCGNKEAKLTAQLDKSKNYLARAEYDKARIELASVLQGDARNVEANFLLGQVLERQQNWRGALSVYQHVIDLNPQHPGARLRLARMYLLGDAPDKAMQQVEELLKGAPNNADALAVRAGIYARRGEEEKARADANAALQAQAGHEDASLLLAGMYMRSNKGAEALALLNESLARNTKSTSLRAVLAELAAQQNDYEKAAKLLNENIGIEPGELGHRMRLASFYVKVKRPTEGERILREAVTQLPDSTDTKLAFVEFIAAQRGREAAEQQLNSYIELQPTVHPLRFGLAKFYENAREFDKAAQIYRDVITRDVGGVGSLNARMKLALVLAQQNKRAEAETVLEEYLKTRPKDDEALLLRATLALDKGEPVKAIADARTVLQDLPASVRAQRVLARALWANKEAEQAKETFQKLATSNPKDSELQMSYVQFLLQAGDTERALAYLQSLVKEAPNNANALEMLLKLQVSKGDWNGALATTEQVKAANPNHPLGYYLAGVVHQQKKDFKAAIHQFEQALQKKPDAVEPLTALVRIYVTQKQPARAAAHLKQTLKQFPQFAIAHNLLGEVLLVQKRSGDAEAAFRKALELDPKLVAPYRSLAAVHGARADAGGAVNIYQQGIAATGGDSTLMFGLAALYERQGDYGKAITEYENYLNKDPTSLPAANNLAMALVTYKPTEQNIARAKELVQRLKTSTNPAFLDTLGWVLYLSGSVEEALPFLEQAVRALPNQPTLYYHLGMALHKKGDLAGAKQNLAKAVRGRVDYPGVDEARAILAKL